MLNGKALIDEIRSAKDIRQVCDLLAGLAGEIRRMLGSGPIALEEAKVLAARVTEIRSLLQELEKFKANSCRDKEGRDVPGSYSELEGMIKEIRNDLDRMTK